MASRVASEPDLESVDPGYRSSVSRGFVSLVGSDEKVPVNILRDSGALDSFYSILQCVLPFSSDSDTGVCALVQGMGLKVLTVPLHKLFLSSDLVEGEVLLGVCSDLPVHGIQVILGNHLAAARMFDVAPSSPVAVPMACTGVASSAVCQACVVTWSQSRADHHTGTRYPAA